MVLSQTRRVHAVKCELAARVQEMGPELPEGGRQRGGCGPRTGE